MPEKRKRDEGPLGRQDSEKLPVSILTNASEVSFPRGGGSVLSALELKKVANEAASEVFLGDDDGDGGSRPVKKKRSKRTTEKSAPEEKDFKMVEHIAFGTLKPNSCLLGQVSSITKNGLMISLMDGVSGFVTMTHISEQFTSILEELDNEIETSDQDEEYAHEISDDKNEDEVRISRELPDLHHYFKLGQWLRCRVSTNSAIKSQRRENKKRRIELSIEPSEVNSFDAEDVNKHTSIQCAVRSIEEHGAILDLGIEGLTGFVFKKDISPNGVCLPGCVFLANVIKRSDRTVTVNFDFQSKNNKITYISSIDAVVAGQVVDFMCQKITERGIFGKVFGMLPGFLGLSESHIFTLGALKDKFVIGSNITCRVVGQFPSRLYEKTLILSILPNVLSLESQWHKKEALDAFPVGYILRDCEILGRDSDFIYLALGAKGFGQVHLIKAGEDLLKSSKRTYDARILGYNSMDKLYQLATDPKILELKYVRAADIPAGELITGCEIADVSVQGIHLKLFNDQFRAFVPSLHISDVKLVYPEKKFKLGSKVKCRILNVSSRGRIFATLKKSLVILDEEKSKMISSFDSAHALKNANEVTLATVLRFMTKGCILGFFGGLHGFLPNAEISEIFVGRPEDHLRLGQTVFVRLIEVDEEKHRIIATCKVSNDLAAQRKEFIEHMIPGRTLVTVQVVEKSKDCLVVELKDLNLRGVIYVGHLSDARIEQNRASLKRVKIGSEFKGLVIDKDVRTRVFNLSLKDSLIRDANEEVLPLNYNDVKYKSPTTPMHGYIKSISEKGIFVAFNGKFVGLILPSYATEDKNVDLSREFYVNQSVTVYLLRIDDEHQRFLLTLMEPKHLSENKSSESRCINPIDESLKELDDFFLGRIIKGKVKAVKKNQLNITLADNLFGRVDIAEIFDNFDDIKDPMRPLSDFKKDDIITVRIIGIHNIRSHKFLPITHQVTNSSVLELTAKPSKLKGTNFKASTIENVELGQKVIGFLNNYSRNHLWFTISPSLKAKASLMNLVDNDTEFSGDIEDNFTLGMALKVKVIGIDKEYGIITVATASHPDNGTREVKPGGKIPSRIVSVNEKYVLLDLGGGRKGISFAVDALNDFSISLPDAFKNKRNQIVLATVLSVEEGDSKVKLSLRSAKAKTPDIGSHDDLKKGDVVEALVKRVNDKGIFVHLSSSLDAFIPVSKLSDSYIKEWKRFYHPMQYVLGRVVRCDEDSRILMTLRESEVNGDLKVLKSYDDIKKGDIFNGHIKNITDFGVFVKLDDTISLTGLAHLTEIADQIPKDLKTMFSVGDRVKAYITKVNPQKKRISLSLKASNFSNEKDRGKAALEANGAIASEDDIMVDSEDYDDSASEIEPQKKRSPNPKEPQKPSGGLSLGADFDWTANILDREQSEEESEDEYEDVSDSYKLKRQKNRNGFVEDKTIEINTRAPESVDDFERLILGNPNSSVLWMNYMAFQLQLSEVDKARDIAERALKTINFREELEKLNIWVALLNLENTFGTEDSLSNAFKRACQYMDPYTIHNKLLAIYQMCGKSREMIDLFKTAAKRFGSEEVSIWVSWGEFLISQNEPQEARDILIRALQTLPKRDHIEVVKKFAQLEFNKGDPERGRSLFEGLIADIPKRIDLWNIYLDQEIKTGHKRKVENIFERLIVRKLTRKQAKFFFTKWLQFEETQNDNKAEEYVKAKAIEYAEKHPKTSDG